MQRMCEKCRVDYDDADCSTICPHSQIMSDENLKQKKAAIELFGHDVCFAHEPNGKRYHIQAMGWNGMLTLAGMSGEFAPHLFVKAK